MLWLMACCEGCKNTISYEFVALQQFDKKRMDAQLRCFGYWAERNTWIQFIHSKPSQSNVSNQHTRWKHAKHSKQAHVGTQLKHTNKHTHTTNDSNRSSHFSSVNQIQCVTISGLRTCLRFSHFNTYVLSFSTAVGCDMWCVTGGCEELWRQPTLLI